jgi:FkbM family methyltransferase
MTSMVNVLRDIGHVLSFGGRLPLAQSLLRRAFRHAGGTYSIDDFDGDLRIDLRLSEHMQRRIFWMGYYNREIVALLDKLVQPGMVVLDVGANIGEISLVCAKRVGSAGSVISFEPMDDIADELQKNIDRNQFRQVTVVRAGLSDKAATQVPIYASCGQRPQGEENCGLGSLYGEKAQAAPVQFIDVTTLDAYLARSPLAKLDVIKVDIEGAELPFLRGAEQALRTHRPQLIVEVQERSAAVAGYTASAILDYLSGLGYTFERIERNGRLSPLTAAELAEYQNVLCTPA